MPIIGERTKELVLTHLQVTEEQHVPVQVPEQGHAQVSQHNRQYSKTYFINYKYMYNISSFKTTFPFNLLQRVDK